MCYYVDQKSSRIDLKIRFNIAISNTRQHYEGVFVNGFSYPNLPIITNEQQNIITTDHTWGLLPSWTKDTDFRKSKPFTRKRHIKISQKIDA